MQAFSLSRDDLFSYSSLSKITLEIEEKVFCIQKEKGELKSISATFFEQILHVQIPKVQKDSQVISFIWQFWDRCK